MSGISGSKTVNSSLNIVCVFVSTETSPLKLHSLSDPFFTQPAPGMLQIEMASLSLAGEYKCVVSDNQDSFERLYYVKVCPGKCILLCSILICSFAYIIYRYPGF